MLTAVALKLWVMTPFGGLERPFPSGLLRLESTLQFLTLAKLQLWCSNENNLILVVTTHEDLN